MVALMRKQGVATDPGPAQDEEREGQRHDVDDQLHHPVGALAPDAVLQVVEHVHGEEVDPGAAPGQQPEQGRPPRRPEAVRGGDQAEGQPAVGQGKGVLELGVCRAGLRGHQRAVHEPGQPVGRDQERRRQQEAGHGPPLTCVDPGGCVDVTLAG